MDNKYGWIDRFKQELDKLDENQADYEQVLQLRLLRKKWEEKTKTILNDLTMSDGESIIIKLKDEIVKDIWNYVQNYISTNAIPMDGIAITKSRCHGSSLHLDVHYEKNKVKLSGTFGLKSAVISVSPVTILSEMIGMDVRRNTWATWSMYDAFHKAKEEHPDWLEKYCSDITRVLDLIKEDSEKEPEEDW